MNRNGFSWSRPFGTIPLLLIFALLAWTCARGEREGEDHGGIDGVANQLDCPGHEVGLPGNTDTVPLAGKISHVIEFHDCQRLVSYTDTMTYGPLVGLWVAEQLDSLPDSLAKLNPNPAQGNAAGVTGIGLAFAELYAWDGNYDPLGIKQGWNCLYLFPSGGEAEYGALMVPVTNASACLAQAAADTLSGRPDVKLLYVHTDTVKGLAVGDYPPVGRWDWDANPRRRVQYIGLGCHDRWCEVTGDSAFVSSRVGNPGAGVGRRGRRVWQVKGWFDQQRLALNPGGQVHPGPAWGTLVPDPDLDARTTVADFRPKNPGDDPWIPVAKAALNRPSPVYQQKFNLPVGQLPDSARAMGWANVSLCTGESPEDCFPGGGAPSCDFSKSDGMWWGRVAVGNNVKYLCVTRVDHSNVGVHIPGTVRWYWVNDDEKLWMACAEGCCRTQ